MRCCEGDSHFRFGSQGAAPTISPARRVHLSNRAPRAGGRPFRFGPKQTYIALFEAGIPESFPIDFDSLFGPTSPTALRMVRHGIIKGRQVCRGPPWGIKPEDVAPHPLPPPPQSPLTANP